jgi:NAD dependent epimerase/dehydratase
MLSQVPRPEPYLGSKGQSVIEGKQILVTGAGGFIGSHLTETMLKAGAKVTALVRYNSSSSIGNLTFLDRDLLSQLNIVAGNIEDGDFVMRAMKDQEIVLHLAALIAIPYSYAAPRSYVRANVEGTLNVLEAARRLGTARVVHTSTSEVYGTAQRTPIDEEHPLQGQSPYSASKIAADKLAEAYFRSFATPVVTVRPFNTYGPRQSARAFIPTIISQALSQDEIRLGSLTPQRDMTFVADTVDGFIRAATSSGVVGETINFGTGETFSIGDFARRILSLMDCRKPIVHDAVRERPPNSEVMKLVSDNQKARALLDWRPETPLDDGLRMTIDFVAANLSNYNSRGYVV